MSGLFGAPSILDDEERDEAGDMPAFELHRPDGSVTKIWASGRVEGVPAGTTIINRIGQIVAAAQKEAADRTRAEMEAEMEDIKFHAAHLEMAANRG